MLRLPLLPYPGRAVTSIRGVSYAQKLSNAIHLGRALFRYLEFNAETTPWLVGAMQMELVEVGWRRKRVALRAVNRYDTEAA